MTLVFNVGTTPERLFFKRHYGDQGDAGFLQTSNHSVVVFPIPCTPVLPGATNIQPLQGPNLIFDIGYSLLEIFLDF
jgi:hypothetical protein